MSLFKKIGCVASLAVTLFILSNCGFGAQATSSRQGWTDQDRESWYWATQGSRLIPEDWFNALEQAENREKFADLDNLMSFGFLAPPEGSGRNRPIGFVKDKQADEDFKISGISWYEGQKHTNSGAEEWMGLTCAACHTAEISYNGVTSTIDGGPNLLDFQLFVEELDKSLQATKADGDKWDRFAAAVLEGRDTPANREILSDAFDTLLGWQIKTDAMNQTDMRYGFGRLDAVGHILNKVLMFADADVSRGNPADAPVSYPFIWDIWRQDRVQWNGVARNSRFQLPGEAFEYGALGRNAGEVLGVFGEINIEKRNGLFGGLRGFKSSVQTENLVELELILQGLEAPKWPDHFPPIDQARADVGKGLFKDNCASCHLTPDLQSEDKGTEVMLPFADTKAEDLTDIWMACNAYVVEGPTGLMQGMKDGDGFTYGPEADVTNMLETAVKGALIGDKKGLVTAAAKNFIGVRKPPVFFETGLEKREADRKTCLTEQSELLAYKARPLDGIWATAPYLHNGSVASLYELLLPAADRKKSFWVGSREFDPVNVGYEVAQPDTGGFLLRVRKENGGIIDGNSNAGHEYGAGALTREQRLSLVEYMKTL